MQLAKIKQNKEGISNPSVHITVEHRLSVVITNLPALSNIKRQPAVLSAMMTSDLLLTAILVGCCISGEVNCFTTRPSLSNSVISLVLQFTAMMVPHGVIAMSVMI